MRKPRVLIEVSNGFPVVMIKLTCWQMVHELCKVGILITNLTCDQNNQIFSIYFQNSAHYIG